MEEPHRACGPPLKKGYCLNYGAVVPDIALGYWCSAFYCHCAAATTPSRRGWSTGPGLVWPHMFWSALVLALPLTNNWWYLLLPWLAYWCCNSMQPKIKAVCVPAQFKPTGCPRKTERKLGMKHCKLGGQDWNPPCSLTCFSPSLPQPSICQLLPQLPWPCLDGRSPGSWWYLLGQV